MIPRTGPLNIWPDAYKAEISHTATLVNTTALEGYAEAHIQGLRRQVFILAEVNLREYHP